MPFTSGTVSKFTNTPIIDEIIFNGDGIQTVFNGTLLNPPVFIDSLSLDYTVSSSPFTATSDSAGNITGTHITTGTLNEDGTWNITYSTAPDDMTDGVADYTAKGVFQKFLEFITDDEKYVINEVVYGSVDGIQTVFTGTNLANTPVSKGAARLKFRIAAQDYYVWADDQDNFVHIFLNSGSVNLTTGEIQADFTTPPDATTDIEVTYSYASVEGRDWIPIFMQNSKDNGGSDAFPGETMQEAIFFNRGKGYQDIINFGTRETKVAAQNFYNWDLNGYLGNVADDAPSWNFNSADHGKTTYTASVESFTLHPSAVFSDQLQAYWIFASKNRVIIVGRPTAGVYTQQYMGFGLRIAPPTKYQNPLLIFGSSTGSFDYIDTSNIAGFDKVDTGSIVNHVMWVDHEDNFDNILQCQTQPITITTTPLMELGTDNKTPIRACYFTRVNNNYTFFILEGVFRIVLNTMQPEDDLLDQSSDTYRVFRPSNIVGQIRFCAVKEE